MAKVLGSQGSASRVFARRIERSNWDWIQRWFQDETLDRELGPLEAMRRTPVNEHLYYGLMRFIERSGFSLDSSEAVALMTYVESERLLGEVWDSIASPKA